MQMFNFSLLKQIPDVNVLCNTIQYKHSMSCEAQLSLKMPIHAHISTDGLIFDP